MNSLRGRGGIFICYRREETAGQAGRLYDRLSARFGADRVFMDVDSVAFGADFTREILEDLYGCNVLLVLIGREWFAITDSTGRRIDNPDDPVRVEIEAALQRDIRVVPVLVDGAALPKTDDLPQSLRPLVRRQARQLSHANFQSDMERLIAELDKVIEQGRTQPARPTVTATRLLDNAERIAQSVDDERGSAKAMARTLAEIAKALAVTDPDRAERIARSIGDEFQRARTLTGIAKALAAAELA